jgi:hypothetical protein
MPSDASVTRALQALSAPREHFLSAVVAAVDEVRAYLERHRPLFDGLAAERARVELGAFAAGRIDASRFGSLFTGGPALDPVSLAVVERALHELERVAAQGEALFRARVAPGADLRLEAAHALAFAGRAFGAAQVVELVRTGRYRPDEHAAMPEAFGFRRWNRAERQIAPPLVIEVDGADLHAGGLAELMDGTQKIVLVVHPPAPPAALVRLITPGVLVVQTTDAADLDAVGRFAGPAVAALVPEGAARFVHHPARGPRLCDRLTIGWIPDEDALAPIGSISVFQQHEELAMLREMAAAPVSIETAPTASIDGKSSSDAKASIETTAAVSSDPATAAMTIPAPSGAAAGDEVERLAAWLLRQADLG